MIAGLLLTNSRKKLKYLIKEFIPL